MNAQNEDVTKLEFVLTLEKNIVIQRFFNVINYNPDAKYSIDLYDSVKEICDEISRDLKMKTLEYLSDNQDYFMEMATIEEPKETKEEYFLLKIKLLDDVFISRIFPAHIYHPKVRYAVDIRPKIRKYLLDLTNVLSATELTKEYMEYELK